MSDYYANEQLPLWNQSRETEREPVQRTEDDKARHAGQKAKLRQLFIDNPNEWFNTSKLARIIGHRFSTSVQSLRDGGMVIKKKPVRDGTFDYQYTGDRHLKRINEDWQSTYYKSRHWRAKRLERLQFDEFRCCNCRSTETLEVHHWYYDLFNEDISDLMTLCERCHKKIHAYEAVKISFPRYVAEEIFKQCSENEAYTTTTRDP